MSKYIYLVCFILFCISYHARAQDLPPCSERNFLVEYPRVASTLYCIELPVDRPDRTYTAMAFDSNDNLYATLPYRGEVVRLVDSDGDALPDTETIVARTLRYPNGIAVHDDVLYVLGDGIIYTIRDGNPDILVDDLPQGRGFIARGLLIHDNLLYAGIPSPCDFCEPDDPLHGTVIQMNLDGTNRRVIARGLRYPTALAMYRGSLYVTDIARDAYDIDSAYDEINRISLQNDEIPHFGFPYCIGDNILDYVSDFDCGTATPPLITLRTNTSPVTMRYYENNAFPHLDESLIVVASGTSNSSFISGHALFSVSISDDGFAFNIIAPSDRIAGSNRPMYWETNSATGIVLDNAEFANNQAGGIYPHFPYALAIDSRGWLYFSVSNRGIYVLRPR